MDYRGLDCMMASTATPPGSLQVSPKGSPKDHKVKFLCSHGGKILPRPADAHLKYVGGETRVISVPRDINFPNLMKKLTYLIDGEMILKYQILPEDLDVKSDEDLRHMFEEYNRHESQGTPRLRTFLFPTNPIITDNPMEPQALEQRYLDAVNGIVRPTVTTINSHHCYKLGPTTNHTSYSLSSACSSPRSPESYTSEATPHEILNQLQTHQNSRLISHQIPKVHSSPNLYNLNLQQQQALTLQLAPLNHHHAQQQHQHHYYQIYKQQLQQANHHHHHHQYHQTGYNQTNRR